VEIAIALETVDQPDALALVGELDSHLNPLYPPESRHGLSLEALRATNVLFAIARDEYRSAHGCGAILLAADHAELKRMYVRPDSRGCGIGARIVRFLEGLAAKNGYTICRLETGLMQAEALSLYGRLGYVRREPFGSYRPDPLSIFMERRIDD
jgi:putative acetyltransferase